MTRWTTLALVLVIVAIGAVIAGVWRLVQRDRAALVDRFGAEQLALVVEAAREIEADLDDISDDLRFSGHLVQHAGTAGERERELRVLLAIVRQYRRFDVFNASGARVLSVTDPRAGSEFSSVQFDEAIRETAERALGRRAGEIETSPAVEDALGWLRVFAMPLPTGGGAIAVLVDTEPYFQRLRLISASADARALLLGPHGRPTPASDPELLAAAIPDLRSLVEAMRTDPDGGTLRLSPSVAARLGFGRADAFASYSPIRVSGGGAWALALIRSTEALRRHERAILFRLGAGSAGIVALLLAFGGFILIASRREATMKERLMTAEKLARLHEKTARMESQLLRAEKLSTVGILAAGIAHEIGTPLGIVRARAEMLAGKLGEDNPLTPGAKVIVEQIDRISRTIRQLLDFSRTKPAAVQPVSVAVVARAVGELLRYEAQRRKAHLSVEVPDDLPFVAADADQLQQVLVNLVMNALDACSPGDRVVVRGREPESSRPGTPYVVVEVEDTGCGIPEEHRHQVFDPFFTTKKRGQGTGLGLTLAAQMVRNHGGEIDLASAPGRGTRVTLLWPVADRRAPTLTMAEEVHEKTA